MSKRLKVLVSAYACNPAVSPQLHPGEDIVGWQLVNQLCRFHDVWVITHSYNKKGFGQDYQEQAISRAKFFFIQLPFPFWLLYKFDIGERLYYYLWQILAWRIAKRLYKKVPFDLAQHITFNNDWIPSYIGAFMPIPFVWGPLGGGQKTPKEFFRTYALQDRFAEYVRDFGQVIGRSLLLTRRRCLKRANAILVCNPDTKKRMPEKYARKVHFFPVNGISSSDLVDFDELNRKATSEKEFFVLSTGRLIHWKNFAAAIRSFKIFSDKFPKTRLFIVGEGPQRDFLQKLARELKVSDKIGFIPRLTREELIKKMRACDVFLYPSLREGGGAVVVEALASGLPVICLDLAGPSIHVREDCGIKIEPRDPDYVLRNMSEALEKLYLDKNRWIQLSQKAVERAKNHYLWDRLGEHLQEIYERITRS